MRLLLVLLLVGMLACESFEFGEGDCATLIALARSQTTRCYTDDIKNPADRQLCFDIANSMLTYARDRGCTKLTDPDDLVSESVKAAAVAPQCTALIKFNSDKARSGMIEVHTPYTYGGGDSPFWRVRDGEYRAVHTDTCGMPEMVRPRINLGNTAAPPDPAVWAMSENSEVLYEIIPVPEPGLHALLVPLPVLLWLRKRKTPAKLHA